MPTPKNHHAFRSLEFCGDTGEVVMTFNSGRVYTLRTMDDSIWQAWKASEQPGGWFYRQVILNGAGHYTIEAGDTATSPVKDVWPRPGLPCPVVG